MGERRFLTPDWIDLGRASLRYAVAGPPDAEGPPLVLLHEMAGSMETWEPAIEILARTHRVIAYDWRGCGQSEKISGEVTLDDHVGDLAALLDALGVGGKPVIAGIAVGSAIVAAFAARHPKRTGGIVLVCPAMGIAADKKAERLQWIDQFEAAGMRSIVENSLAGGYPERFRTGREDLFATFRARWIGNDPHSFGATYRMLLDFDMPPILARIACPALVVAGEFDPNRTPQYARGIAGQIPGAAFKVVAGGHHMPHQVPEICADFVSEFAATLPGYGET